MKSTVQGVDFLEDPARLPSTDGSTDERSFTPLRHDGKVHNPLGGGSYIFRNEYISSHIRYLGLPLPDSPSPSYQPTTLIIHIGAQPNNSPHAGTIVVFILAFLIAREIKAKYASLHAAPDASEELKKFVDDLSVVVRLNIVDTAPDNDKGKASDGYVYQRSQRFTKAQDKFLPDYRELLDAASAFTNVPYDMTNQEALMRMPSVPRIIEAMVKDHVRLGPEIAPDTRCLAMRRACPHSDCGFAEKHGRRNRYTILPSGSVKLEFYCADHGYHSVESNDPDGVASLEFNTPARNIVRSLAYSIDTHQSRADLQGRARVHLRVTGMDYTGTYAEQLLWRQLVLLYPSLLLSTPIPMQELTPVIAYAPLILDWSGSKLSKSLYVSNGAYEYLKDAGMGYLLSFGEMKKMGRRVEVLFREVEGWLADGKKLFRGWTVEYLHGVFERELGGDGGRY